MLRGLLQQSQAECSRDQFRKRAGRFSIGSSPTHSIDNKRLATQDFPTKENGSHRGGTQKAPCHDKDSTRNGNTRQHSSSNHKTHGEQPPPYCKTSRNVDSHRLQEKRSRPYDPTRPLYSTAQNPVADSYYPRASPQQNVGGPNVNHNLQVAQNTTVSSHMPQDSRNYNGYQLPYKRQSFPSELPAKGRASVPPMVIQHGQSSNPSFLSHKHAPNSSINRSEAQRLNGSYPYQQQQSYVPSNPSILPLACDPRPAQQYVHRRPRCDSSGLNLSRPFLQQPSSSSRPSVNHSNSPCPLVLNAATRAKLKRKLAITILTEKLQQTMEMRQYEGRIEYDPETPAYEHYIYADRVGYNPCDPAYFE